MTIVTLKTGTNKELSPTTFLAVFQRYQTSRSPTWDRLYFFWTSSWCPLRSPMARAETYVSISDSKNFGNRPNTFQNTQVLSVLRQKYSTSQYISALLSNYEHFGIFRQLFRSQFSIFFVQVVDTFDLITKCELDLHKRDNVICEKKDGNIVKEAERNYRTYFVWI